MVEELEIIEPKRGNIKKKFIFFFSLFLLILIVFFGYKAYSLTKKVMVAGNANGSPFLNKGDINSWMKGDNLEKLRQEDRRINILLLGAGGENHPGGNLTDTIMVVSIDPKNKEAAMLSIPRDLFVNVKGYGEAKINSVLSINDGKIKSGEKNYNLMKQTTGDFLGISIHYFALINFDAFKQIIDIFGGVDVNVEKDLNDPLYPDENVLGYDPLYIKKGEHHFDGEMALKYARSRETTSDFDRAKRQQLILVALGEKAAQRENLLSVKRISQTMQVLSDNVKTDMQVPELESLAVLLRDIKKEGITHKVLDDSTGLVYSDNYDGMYVLVPQDKTLKATHLFVDQYFKDPFLAEEKARIRLTNGSGNDYIEKLILKDIKDYGFDIENNAVQDEGKKYPKTFIYDYSNNKKSGTISFLKNYFNSEIQVVVLNDKSKDYDIEIVLGSDYKYTKK